MHIKLYTMLLILDRDGGKIYKDSEQSSYLIYNSLTSVWDFSVWKFKQGSSYEVRKKTWAHKSFFSTNLTEFEAHSITYL